MEYNHTYCQGFKFVLRRLSLTFDCNMLSLLVSRIFSKMDDIGGVIGNNGAFVFPPLTLRMLSKKTWLKSVEF